MSNAFKTVYNKKIVCYNLAVKKFAILTTTLLAAVLTATGGVAFAEETAHNDTHYPESFTRKLEFTALADYAVGNGAYAFAEGNVVKVVENRTLTQYSFDFNVTALDFADGVFYYRDGNNAVYSLPDSTPSSHEFKTDINIISGNYHYFINDYGVNIVDTNKPANEPGVTLADYSNLKQFDDNVYAVCDNALYTLNGVLTTKITLEYIDYSSAQEIYVGDTAAELRNDRNDIVKIATIRSSTADGLPVYMTEIDLSELSEKFSVGATLCVGDENAPAGGEKALLLCETGNSYIIAIGSTAYIIANTGADITNSTLSTPSYNSATLSVGGSAYAYYSPYINTNTQASLLTTGKNVTVLGMADKTAFPFLAYNFYVISYTEGEQTVTGYVPEGYLSEFTFIEREPQTTKDPDYSEDDLVKTVVLILIVIVLVMIALGYLIFVATSSKRKNEANDQTDPGDDK